MESQGSMHFAGLTATEVSNLWSAYLKNSMELRLFVYFFASTENNEIRSLIEQKLNQAQNNINELKDLLIKEKLALPLGFTGEDVNVNTQKVFSDTFILHFCFDLTQLTLSTYPMALSDCTRKDVRLHFQTNIETAMAIQNKIVELMLVQGVYLRPPQVAIDSNVEFADSIIYLNGFFGGSRPVNAPEIANLSRIIHRAQFSKMVFVTFSQLAKTKALKHHFGKGRDEIQKILDSLQEVLDKENIPMSASGDYAISNTEIPPYSDKLMLFFVNSCLGLFCFTMVSQAMTSCLRMDIMSKLEKISEDMKKYFGHGLLLAIKEKWFEQPPQAADRKV